MSAMRIVRAVALGLMAISLPASAFRSDFHLRYSLQAGELLGKCRALGVAVPTDPQIDAFAKATKAEDDTSIERISNWHYARNAGMPRYFLPGIQMDLQRIFDRRIDELFECARSAECRRDELFRRAGSVAHYIQDMRVPAHILPISHGSVFGKDEFDGHAFGVLPVAPEAAQVCEAWRVAAEPSRDKLARMLAEARVHTRTRMHARIRESDPAECTWSKAFWCDPLEGPCEGDFPGFGSHRKSKFGDLHVECVGSKVPLRLTPDDYDKFFREAHAAMLVDTVTVLLMASELASGCRDRTDPVISCHTRPDRAAP